MVHDSCWFLSAMVLCMASAVAFGEDGPKRNDWYRHATLIIHCDNHSGLLGKGLSVDELVKALGFRKRTYDVRPILKWFEDRLPGRKT